MAIRAFLSTWKLVETTVQIDEDEAGNPIYGVQREIHNPIVDHIDTQPDQGIICSMIYPDADGNGLPDKPVVLVLVESQKITGQQIEQLKNLEGVTLLPSGRPDKRIVTLPPSAKADLDGIASQHGVPQSAINGANTLGDALRNIEKYVNPNSNGVASYLAKRPAEFG